MIVEPRTDDRRLVATGWLAIGTPILAWMAHLIFCAGYAAATGRGRTGVASGCRYGATSWPFHVATAATVVICLVSLAAALHVLRSSGADGREAGHLRFLGLLGIGSSVSNLVLILGEGSIVVFLHSCA